MPKLKTHKGAAKRFRTTATGKIKRGHSHARHILTKKSTKRKRLLDIDGMVSDSDMGRVEGMLPYCRRQSCPDAVDTADTGEIVDTVDTFVILTANI